MFFCFALSFSLCYRRNSPIVISSWTHRNCERDGEWRVIKVFICCDSNGLEYRPMSSEDKRLVLNGFLHSY